MLVASGTGTQGVVSVLPHFRGRRLGGGSPECQTLPPEFGFARSWPEQAGSSEQ